MFGKVFNAALGPTEYEVLSLSAQPFGGGALLKFEVLPEFTEHNFAVFVNGAYSGVFACSETPNFTVQLPLSGPGSAFGIYVEDVGVLTQLSTDVAALVGQRAQAAETAAGNKLSFTWDNVGQYTLTPVKGDSQLANIQVTGLRRGVNCQPLADEPTRARIYYSIEEVVQ